MDNSNDTINKLLFLVRAESRIHTLERLSLTEPATRRELCDALPASRSTIVRAIDSLVEVGWVSESADGVRLTPVGQVVIEEFLDLVDAVGAAEELTSFLEWFPLSEFEIGIDELRDGTVTETADGDPYAPVRQHTALLQTTSQFQALLPSIGINGIKQIHTRTVAGELDPEFVVPTTVESTIRSEQFAPLFDEMLATGRLTIHLTDSVPFFLGLGDDGVTQIGVEDDNGIPRALLETSNETVRSWGAELFTDYRSSAADQLTEL